MDDVCEGKDFSFPQQEKRVLELWAKLDAFHEQLRRTEGGEEFVFYDGPPFATGLPHYGHILAGTIKDVVTRHQSMRGRHVSRRFGWDSHGLPVEFEIDKALGITNRQEVFDLGIGKYNETCRSIVTKSCLTAQDAKLHCQTLRHNWTIGLVIELDAAPAKSRPISSRTTDFAIAMKVFFQYVSAVLFNIAGHETEYYLQDGFQG